MEWSYPLEVLSLDTGIYYLGGDLLNEEIGQAGVLGLGKRVPRSHLLRGGRSIEDSVLGIGGSSFKPAEVVYDGGEGTEVHRLQTLGVMVGLIFVFERQHPVFRHRLVSKHSDD